MSAHLVCVRVCVFVTCCRGRFFPGRDGNARRRVPRGRPARCPRSKWGRRGVRQRVDVGPAQRAARARRRRRGAGGPSDGALGPQGAPRHVHVPTVYASTAHHPPTCVSLSPAPCCIALHCTHQVDTLNKQVDMLSSQLDDAFRYCLSSSVSCTSSSLTSRAFVTTTTVMDAQGT